MITRIKAALRDHATRCLAEPHQLVITIIVLVAIFGGSLIFMHRLVEGPTLSDEEIAKEREGVIVVKSPDSIFCEQRKFDNMHGNFSNPSTFDCSDRSSPSLNAVRNGFRGNK